MTANLNLPLLEVIVSSVEDAVSAKKGGANRLEIVRNLEHGGLTPSVDLVEQIKHAVDLPLRVMVRESVGFEVNNEAEIVDLCVAAEKFARLGVDGLVLGYLKDGRIDVPLCERILSHAPNLKATFHHAFENARHQLKAVAEIKSLPQVDHILSNGSAETVSKKILHFEQYQREASPEIGIIAGGGLDLEEITAIGCATQIREFHVGRAARLSHSVDGDVSAELVSQLVRTINSIK